MRSKITIIPLGDVEFALINKLSSNLASLLSLTVETLHAMEIPLEAYNQGRGQYYSTVILNKLQLLKLDEKERVLGITEEDLYSPAVSYLFGDADSESKVAVASTFRLKQEFSGFPENEDLFYRRILKEAVHQLGRTFNLDHCPNAKCVMYSSNHIVDIDLKQDRFCDNCKRKMLPN
ncbi:MAG: archaemetzincin [candidate division Zixibacteria bacterium]|nr:archaemetzincin [candidate division Zixibacteria bacterium]